MLTWLLLLAGAAALIALIGYGIRGLAHFRHETGHAWQQIELQLHLRHEMVWELIEHCGHLPTLEAMRERIVTHYAASKSAESISAVARAESALTHSIQSLLHYLETCPEETVKHEIVRFRETLETIEEKIRFATQYHNLTATAHNRRLQRFPHRLIGPLVGAPRLELFEIHEPDMVNQPPSRMALDC